MDRNDVVDVIDRDMWIDTIIIVDSPGCGVPGNRIILTSAVSEVPNPVIDAVTSGARFVYAHYDTVIVHGDRAVEAGIPMNGIRQPGDGLIVACIRVDLSDPVIQMGPAFGTLVGIDQNNITVPADGDSRPESSGAGVLARPPFYTRPFLRSNAIPD